MLKLNHDGSTVTYRIAKRSDFATDLILQRSLFDYWGHVVLPINTRVNSQSQEDALLSQSLWIWEGPLAPTMPPKDTQTPLSFKSWCELEMDSLRKLAKSEHVLPANFLSIIWRHSCTIELINKSCPWHPLAFLCFGNHPSNALRNTYSCAILADRVCSKLGMTVHERRSVVCAALTMNWTIFELQDKLSSSKLNPTGVDMQKIKTHPDGATRWLKDMGLLNEHWLRAVEQHHEEPDGKGYPLRLTLSQTYLGAQVLRACDRFVAMTSSRRFRTGMLTCDALKNIQSVVPNHEGVFTAISNDLGDKPPGGIWLDSRLGHLYLSLGIGTQGLAAAFVLNAESAPPNYSFDELVETLHPGWDNVQYFLAVSRVDKLGYDHLIRSF